MVKEIRWSIKNINFKLFITLLVLGFCPTIYTTVRVYFIGQMPNEWAFSIAGQLSWVNLLYEVLNEAIILPLFYFMGKVLSQKDEFLNRIKTCLVLTFFIYFVFSLIIICTVNPLLRFMAVDQNILEEASNYIRLESLANIFFVLSSFLLVVLVTIDKEKYLYILTIARLILNIIFDTFLVSSLNISLNLGVNGIGISNIIVNGILFLASVFMLKDSGYDILKKEKLNYKWISEFIKIGSTSGIESFVRNIVYMLMIVRMINVVNEQGTYWVANSFIWSWLLLPILQLGELIKQEVSTDRKNIRKNSLGYFVITAVICVLWIITIPLWKPFMTVVLGCADVDKLFSLVIVLLGFYILFAFQNVFDATFYGIGKTDYMLFESVMTNCIYYGIAFVFYLKGVYLHTITDIALFFGFGMAFDSIVSLIAYCYLLKKEKINLFQLS